MGTAGDRVHVRQRSFWVTTPYMGHNGVDLPADIADNVADILVELRGILQPIGNNIILCRGWNVQGAMILALRTASPWQNPGLDQAYIR